jgi:hypothetical protein
MGTVTINTRTYTTYGDVAGATIYFDASIAGAPWADLDPTTQARALKTATDVFDRLGWVGEVTDSAQALAWPRVGVTDRNSNPIDSTIIPDDVIDACYELALALAQDSSILTSSDGTGSKIKEVASGSDRVSYFTWVDGTRWPTQVTDIIGLYLSNGGSLAPDNSNGADAFGTCTKRTFPGWERNDLFRER